MTNRDSVDRFFDYNLYLPERTVFLEAEVDEACAGLFLKAMAVLGTSDKAISVIMNNIGGDEYHGLAIYDAIATSKSHVTVTVFGHAMSMGSWILQAADDRVVAPNSTLMIHYGTWANDDVVQNVRASHKEMERLNKLMEDTYLERMRQVNPRVSLAALRKMLVADTYLTAQRAVEIGLADRVLA